MKPKTWVRVRQVFEQALDYDAEARGAFLARACRGEPEVLAEVQRLLREDSTLHPHGSSDAGGRARVRAGLDALGPDALLEDLGRATAPLGPGVRVGRYELLRVLAQGGMGTVYEAVQETPRRTVALKTMNHGLSSDAGRRRFLFESEVLGTLQHPGIAQIYESGTHVDGERVFPYFAMELVEGATDLLRYARSSALDLTARINLFLDVCDAVHHGHQKGVIHRDLKPNNILVSADGRAKVIDFGVARATGANIATTAAQTQFGQLVGTLAYMSPEQLGGDPRAVDTRSDVYSLGVVLYELVSDSRPYELEGLSIQEVVRLVQEAPPLRPKGAPADLTWILLKALEKEPGRRYASASELAADLRRFLNEEPVLAGAPSFGYRVKKFARRHRMALISIGAILAALTFGLFRAGSEARAARREADKALGVSHFLGRMLASVSPLETGREARVIDVLEEAARSTEREFEHSPAARAVVENVIGRSYMELRVFDKAREHLDRAQRYIEQNVSADDPLALDLLTNRVSLLYVTHEWEQAEQLGREGEPRVLARLGPTNEVTLRLAGAMAQLLMDMGMLEEAEERFDSYIPRLEAVYGEEHPEVIGARGGRAIVWQRSGHDEKAQTEFEAVLAVAERVLPADHWRLGNARFNLAIHILTYSEDREELERCAVELRKIRAAVGESLGASHPFYLPTSNALGACLKKLTRYDEALALFEEAAAKAEELYGAEDRDVLYVRENIAFVLEALDRVDEAEAVTRELIEPAAAIFEPEHGFVLSLHTAHARFLEKLGRQEEAHESLSNAFEAARGSAFQRELGDLMEARVRLLAKAERSEEAALWLSETLPELESRPELAARVEGMLAEIGEQ